MSCSAMCVRNDRLINSIADRAVACVLKTRIARHALRISPRSNGKTQLEAFRVYSCPAALINRAAGENQHEAIRMRLGKRLLPGVALFTYKGIPVFHRRS